MSRDKAALRARARELREAEARRQRRREQLIRFGVIAGVAVVVLAVAVAIFASRPSADDSAAMPIGVSAPDGGVVVGDGSAPVTIDLWIDFQCPFCRDFEQASGTTLDDLVAPTPAPGSSTTRCRSWARSPSGRPTRSAARSTRAGRRSTSRPVREPTSRGDRRLHQRGPRGVGRVCGVTGRRLRDLRRTTAPTTPGSPTSRQRQQDAGVTSTPTVVVDGQTLDAEQLTPEGVRAAVEQAAA